MGAAEKLKNVMPELECDTKEHTRQTRTRAFFCTLLIRCDGSLPYAIGADLLIIKSSITGNDALIEGGGLTNFGTAHLQAAVFSGNIV